MVCYAQDSEFNFASGSRRLLQPFLRKLSEALFFLL